MLTVGLTGGIASGKSTVAAMLVEMGARLVDTDQLARRALEPGSPGRAEVVAALGTEVLDQEGNLDRPRLRQRIFSDAAARARLNAIVHPRVAALVEGELARMAAETPRAVALIDVPLLFESGWESRFAVTLLVYCPAAEQVRRLMARDGVDEPAAIAALAAQMPLEQKRELAQFVIDNSGDMEDTRAQVRAVWSVLLRMSA